MRKKCETCIKYEKETQDCKHKVVWSEAQYARGGHFTRKMKPTDGENCEAYQGIKS